MTSGSDVTQWTDVSGAGNHASQSNSANKPTLIANTINGAPVVSFDGSSDFLQLPGGLANFTSGATIFLVTKPTSLTSGAMLFDLGNGTASDNVSDRHHTAVAEGRVFSAALTLFKDAWERSRHETGQAQKAVADRAVAELVLMNAKLFLRSASLSYDSSLTNLVSITDVIGLTSKFAYDESNSFITLMTTPYGSTAFHLYTPPFSVPQPRGLRIVFPDGTFTVHESWIGFTRATYFWDREATILMTRSPASATQTPSTRHQACHLPTALTTSASPQSRTAGAP
ncbi:MAG TPA: hypothetical protein V6D17_13030 [Candidatus Obscuribacterales bacterium]